MALLLICNRLGAYSRLFAMKIRRRAVPTLSEAVSRYLAEISPLKKGLTTERSLARIWLA
jgi:hypothetical protein